MKKLVLEDHGLVYAQEDRRPDARLYQKGELVRFLRAEESILRGTVLRVDRVLGAENIVQLKRRSGQVIDWSPSRSVEVFAPSDGVIRRGSVFEWTREHDGLGARQGDLARVVDVHPLQGITVRSHQLGEVRFALSPGSWHHQVRATEIVAHHRQSPELRLEPFRDHDPAPAQPTHEKPLDELARPFTLVTHGVPPPMDVLERGDIVYFASTRSNIPENNAFRVKSIARREGRVQLANGIEVSSNPSRSCDFEWALNARDEVRLYKPAQSIAAQDLVVWRRDDPNTLVRKGAYAEVLEVRTEGVVLSGVTSRPEVLQVDPARWSREWHRENESWQLIRRTECSSEQTVSLSEIAIPCSTPLRRSTR